MKPLEVGDTVLNELREPYVVIGLGSDPTRWLVMTCPHSELWFRDGSRTDGLTMVDRSPIVWPT